MSLKDKRAVVTGGSRGLGLGLVEALVAEGANVTVVARGMDALEAVEAQTWSRDHLGRCNRSRRRQSHPCRYPTGYFGAHRGCHAEDGTIGPAELGRFFRCLGNGRQSRPVLASGALNLPLRPGSRVLVGSSGAAVTGWQMSGGYGGSKRMLWFMAKYANGISQELNLGIRFQAIVPRQMILGTGTGDAAAGAYSGSMGITPEQFVARFGAPMPPREFGDRVVLSWKTRNTPMALCSASTEMRA